MSCEIGNNLFLFTHCQDNDKIPLSTMDYAFEFSINGQCLLLLLQLIGGDICYHHAIIFLGFFLMLVLFTANV